jgi:hypothetical protein
MFGNRSQRVLASNISQKYRRIMQEGALAAKSFEGNTILSYCRCRVLALGIDQATM